MRCTHALCWLLSLVVIPVFTVHVALLPALAWADKDDDDDDDDVVHDLMEKTHEGKKSPWRQVQRAADSNPIDWATINAALPRLGAMSNALVNAKDKEVRELADGYVDAVQELATQAKKQDAAGTRGALKSLSNSCADCHFKGGPGGKLDD